MPDQSPQTPMSPGTSQLQQAGAINSHLVVVGAKQLITEGVQAFEEFDRRANELDHALRLFRSSIQLLGFSAGVLHATYQLRKGIMRLQFYFRENAAWLYNDEVKPHEKRDIHMVKPNRNLYGRANGSAPNPLSNSPQKDPENVLQGMERLRDSVEMFVQRVNERSRFQDESVNQSFLSFADDLEYRVRALGRYKQQLNSRPFKERINKLATGFGQHMHKMKHALKEFQATGIPIIQGAQHHRGHRLQVLSAVATFFSGVTASTIQYRVNEASSNYQDAVNGLWIMSLACSLACAISAQISYHWRTSRFSESPESTPAIILYVLECSPLFYLCSSVSTFMVGLSVFTFSSNQHRAVSVTVTIFTGIILLQLVHYAVWYILEREVYVRTKGEQGFFQVLADQHKQLYKVKDIQLRVALLKILAPRRPRAPVEQDKEAGPGNEVSIKPNQKDDLNQSKMNISPRMRLVVEKMIQHSREEKIRKLIEKYQDSRRNSSVYLSYADKQEVVALQLFNAVGKHNGLIKHLAFSPNGRLLATCGWDGRAIISHVDDNILLKCTLQHTENPSSAASLAQLRILGKHTAEELVREVAWSPDSQKLATLTEKAVRIWNVVDGTLEHQIPHSQNYEAIAWTPSGRELILIKHVPASNNATKPTVGSTYVVRYTYPADLQGGSTGNMFKDIKDAKVTNMALVDDSTLIAVGSCLVDTGVKKIPKSEKTLILFNFVLGDALSMVPLSGEVRGVDITHPQKNIWLVLLTYKHEKAFPELWKINMHVPQKEFHLIRTYFAKASCDFSGRGCFGGPEDIYVCCSSQDGEIYIWNRDTGLLLHTVHPDNDEHIKFFACNKRAFPDFLCASGAVDGMLSIWGSRNRIAADNRSEAATVTNSTRPYFDGNIMGTPRRMSSSVQPAARQSSLLTNPET